MIDRFTREGEKCYWLHVAIDRFAGEIIDQQVEAVYEGSELTAAAS